MKKKSLFKGLTVGRLLLGAAVFIATGFLYSAGSDIYARLLKKKEV